VVVNLDPGNDMLPYDCAVDVMDLVKLEEVMDELELGPNGGLVYCMEYIEQNLDWLQEKLATECKDKYILFDLPGQVELFTHHGSVPAPAAPLPASVCLAVPADTPPPCPSPMRHSRGLRPCRDTCLRARRLSARPALTPRDRTLPPSPAAVPGAPLQVRAISDAIVSWGWQLCVVHLVDGHHCSDSSKFISTALVSLAAMTMLGLGVRV